MFKSERVQTTDLFKSALVSCFLILRISLILIGTGKVFLKYLLYIFFHFTPMLSVIIYELLVHSIMKMDRPNSALQEGFTLKLKTLLKGGKFFTDM